MEESKSKKYIESLKSKLLKAEELLGLYRKRDGAAGSNLLNLMQEIRKKESEYGKWAANQS